MTRPYDAIIAMGSNIGDKAGHIDAAVAAFTADGLVRLVARSADYRTAPWGITDQDWFVNACMSVATDLPVRASLGLFTQPISFIGLPVVAVPLRNEGAMPIGVQLIARPYNEQAVLRVAAHLEKEGVTNASPA